MPGNHYRWMRRNWFTRKGVDPWTIIFIMLLAVVALGYDVAVLLGQ
jgi:hypothetical protein